MAKHETCQRADVALALAQLATAMMPANVGLACGVQLLSSTSLLHAAAAQVIGISICWHRLSHRSTVVPSVIAEV